MLEIKCALCWNMHSVISLLWYNVVLMHVDRVHAHWLGVKLQHIYIYKKNIILNAHAPLKCYCLHSKKITMAVPMGHKEPIDMKLHISETFLFHQLEISGIPQVWRLCTQTFSCLRERYRCIELHGSYIVCQIWPVLIVEAEIGLSYNYATLYHKTSLKSQVGQI